MSMTADDFEALLTEIMSQGYDRQTAARFAGLIGDIPHIDEDGSVVVLEKGHEIARFKPLKSFE